MEKSKPRVLLIGAGGYGIVYLTGLLRDGYQGELVGVCDVACDIAKRMPIIEKWNVPVYAHPADFYAEHHADLAIISTPVHTHKALALCCLEHGSHVLCEKPLCLTLEDAQEMMDAAKKADRFLALGYQLNYRRDVLALKQDILAGRFGAPKRCGIVQAFRRGISYYKRNDWAGKIAVNGNEVFDSPFSNASAHCFQMMTFLLGDAMNTCCDVLSAEAELYRGNPDVENYDIAALRFESSCGAQLMYYTAHPILEDIAPRGVFEFEHAIVTFDSWQPSFRATLKNGVVIDYSHVSPGLEVQKLADALEAVHHGRAPVCGAETDIAHIRAVRMVQKLPILPVREALRIRHMENEEEYIGIQGLDDLFMDCLNHFALPSELRRSLV